MGVLGRVAKGFAPLSLWVPSRFLILLFCDTIDYGKNNINGIDFLSGDYDIGVCGDLFMAALSTAAAAFFYTIYTAITVGRRRKKRSVRYVPLFRQIPHTGADLLHEAFLKFTG